MAKDKKYPTSKADFEYFKKHCWWWIRYFGILSYDYYFFHDNKISGRAQFASEFESRIVSVTMNIVFTERFTRYDLAAMAFHEIFESMLNGLLEMASRSYRVEAVAECSHAVVNTLENTLFEEKWASELKRLK